MGELKYMHAVTMEVLRLHPSVPKDVKFAVKDDVLPDGTKVGRQIFIFKILQLYYFKFIMSKTN